MGEMMDFSASGGTVTAVTMGYEFNLLGAATALNGRNSESFVPINDALVEKEIPKPKVDEKNGGVILQLVQWQP